MHLEDQKISFLRGGAGSSVSQGAGGIQATLLKPFLFLLSLPSLQCSLPRPLKFQKAPNGSPHWALHTPLPGSPPSCSVLSLLLQFEHAALRASQVKILILPAPVLFHCSPSLVLCPCVPFLVLQAQAQLQTFSPFQMYFS